MSASEEKRLSSEASLRDKASHSPSAIPDGGSVRLYQQFSEALSDKQPDLSCSPSSSCLDQFLSAGK